MTDGDVGNIGCRPSLSSLWEFREATNYTNYTLLFSWLSLVFIVVAGTHVFSSASIMLSTDLAGTATTIQPYFSLKKSVVLVA